jgi:pimeloyl-ACP methyl ester carboxylesterase
MLNATLVTIHGFWSSPATWERLNAVWYADEQLRGLQIYPFGYSSPKRPRLPFSTTRVPDYDDVAQTLATEYTVRLAEASDIAIVTHSQGGLILQRFLTWMLHQGRGQELTRIRTIVMLACPNTGSEYLRSLRHVLGFSRHPQASNLDVLNRQIADTQRTVLQGIVNASGVDDHQCRIPFHVYAGNADKIVTAASAQGAFPGASTLAGNHFSILDPAALGNRTAETVKYHLLTDPARSAPEAPSASDALPGSDGVAAAAEAGEAAGKLTQTQPAKPEQRSAPGGQAIIGSSVGGDATQIRGVKGNVRIGRGGARPVPVDPTPNAAHGGPPDDDAQTVTDSQVSGHVSQIDDVGGDVEMD